MNISDFFSETVKHNASDLHLLANYPPMLRISGKLTPILNIEILTEKDIETLIFSILTEELKNSLFTNREIDFSYNSTIGRFRANVYYQRETIGATFRYINEKIPSIKELGLPDICYDFINLHQGFVLVTGPTGHGKSTTLASMIQEINQSNSLHIITIEDPIEFIYPQGQSIISQREMHTDTKSWDVALRSALREDPDVVLIGEMRDFETIQAALTIAETGHLVFATLHTNSASQTIDRIVGSFPEHQQPQIRLQLSNTLEAVISQRLVPAIKGGMVLINEILIATPAVRSTIREGRTHLIDNIIQTSVESGMITLEMSLAKKIKEGIITPDVAMTYTLRPEELSRLIKTY
ncbi:MAG: type IV pilus twitching motility protein PilT [Patescibacteria group bacterium]|nr:type IV pilus twitching motility protein PilT [Patescibacteria group bacterium]